MIFTETKLNGAYVIELGKLEENVDFLQEHRINRFLKSLDWIQ